MKKYLKLGEQQRLTNHRRVVDLSRTHANALCSAASNDAPLLAWMP
jgi:hypothetical protein